MTCQNRPNSGITTHPWSASSALSFFRRIIALPKRWCGEAGHFLVRLSAAYLAGVEFVRSGDDKLQGNITREIISECPKQGIHWLLSTYLAFEEKKRSRLPTFCVWGRSIKQGDFSTPKIWFVSTNEHGDDRKALLCQICRNPLWVSQQGYWK